MFFFKKKALLVFYIKISIIEIFKTKIFKMAADGVGVFGQKDIPVVSHILSN